MEAFGEKIKRLRESRDLTQEQLAALVGVHQTKISHCENGRRGVSIPLVAKLANALNADFEDLMASALETEQERAAA